MSIIEQLKSLRDERIINDTNCMGVIIGRPVKARTLEQIATLNAAIEKLAAIETLEQENKALREALEFYADYNHWMALVEDGDHSNLIAHGPNFNGTSNGWVEARAALEKINE